MDTVGKLKNSTYITVFSNASLDTYPNNSNTRFTCVLDDTIRDCQSVRLSKFSYPSIHNVTGVSFQQAIYNLEDYIKDNNYSNSSFYTSKKRARYATNDIDDLLKLMSVSDELFLSYDMEVPENSYITSASLNYFVTINFTAERVALFETMLKELGIFDLYSTLVEDADINRNNIEQLYRLWLCPMTKDEINHDLTITVGGSERNFTGKGYFMYILPTNDEQEIYYWIKANNPQATSRFYFNRFISHEIPYTPYIDKCFNFNPFVDDPPPPIINGRAPPFRPMMKAMNQALQYSKAYSTRLYADTDNTSTVKVYSAINPINYPFFWNNRKNFTNEEIQTTARKLVRKANYRTEFANGLPTTSIIKPFKWLCSEPITVKSSDNFFPDRPSRTYTNSSWGDVPPYEEGQLPPEYYSMGYPNDNDKYYTTVTPLSDIEVVINMKKIVSTDYFNSFTGTTTLLTPEYLSKSVLMSLVPCYSIYEDIDFYNNFQPIIGEWNSLVILKYPGPDSTFAYARTYNGHSTGYVTKENEGDIDSLGDLKFNTAYESTPDFKTTYCTNPGEGACMGRKLVVSESYADTIVSNGRFTPELSGLSMIIYAPNIISYGMIGDVRAPYLDIIEYIRPNYDQMQSYEPTGSRINHRPVTNTDIDRINIDILDDYGKPFQLLRRSAVPVILELEIVHLK